MNTLNFFTAFLFGFLSFFSPCTLPLVPSFLCYLGGISFDTIIDRTYSVEERNAIIIHVLLYILGASFVLVFLGISVGTIGYFFRTYRFFIQQIGGIVVLLFGLYTLLVSFTYLPFHGQVALPAFLSTMIKKRKESFVYMYMSSFLLGIVFSLSWIPCISAVLGSILILAGQTSSFTYGGVLLFTYALGQALPLLLIAFFFTTYIVYIKRVKKYLRYATIVSGLCLMLLGLLLIFGLYAILTSNLYLLFTHIIFFIGN